MSSRTWLIPTDSAETVCCSSRWRRTCSPSLWRRSCSALSSCARAGELGPQTLELPIVRLNRAARLAERLTQLPRLALELLAASAQHLQLLPALSGKAMHLGQRLAELPHLALELLAASAQPLEIRSQPTHLALGRQSSRALFGGTPLSFQPSSLRLGRGVLGLGPCVLCVGPRAFRLRPQSIGRCDSRLGPSALLQPAAEAGHFAARRLLLTFADPERALQRTRGLGVAHAGSVKASHASGDWR